MVPSEEEEVIRELDFVRKEKAYGLYALFSSIYIVSKEHVVGIWWESAIFEQSQEVWILPMYITCNPQNNMISLLP